MSDVRIFQTVDGGEITCNAGQIVIDDGLDTAVFLSLFGGNDDDSGLEGDDPRQWWGNTIETEATQKHRSLTQNLLRGLPLIPANLLRIEDAAMTDLAWMTETELASFVSASASMPALNTVKLTIKAEIQSKPFEESFVYRRSRQ